DEEQRLAGVRQRHVQDVEAPRPLVRDADALLALAAGRDLGSIGVDDRLREERLRLLPPDLKPRLVEDLLQDVDVGRREAPTEVAGGRRIRDTLCTERVQVALARPEKLEILDAG